MIDKIEFLFCKAELLTSYSFESMASFIESDESSSNIVDNFSHFWTLFVYDILILLEIDNFFYTGKFWYFTRKDST